MIIVTGVSRGLGKAIVERYLNNGEQVIGIGRSHSFDHPGFQFMQCDLSNLEEVRNMEFEQFETPITLINNAGIIGNVNRLSGNHATDIDRVLTVNVSAVAILMQKVYAAVSNKNDFTLVNISSGAGRRAIPSWAAYCASKAALNMLTETFFEEEKELGRSPKVLSVAPGVIDTGMQTQIRNADSSQFSGLDNFVRLKDEGELYSPEHAALRLEVLLTQKTGEDIFHDLRNVEISQ